MCTAFSIAGVALSLTACSATCAGIPAAAATSQAAAVPQAAVVPRGSYVALGDSYTPSSQGAAGVSRPAECPG
jgi:hypothetical protein